MTNVIIVKKDKIDTIEIKGHTNYSESGSDIVCASISSIIITSANICLRIDNSSISYEISDGYMKITVLKHSEIIDLVINNILEELKTLEKKYKKYIKINI